MRIKQSSWLTIIAIFTIVAVNLGCFGMPVRAEDHRLNSLSTHAKPACCDTDPMTQSHLAHHKVISSGTLVPIIAQNIFFIILTAFAGFTLFAFLASTAIKHFKLLSFSLDPPRFSVLRC